MEHVVGGLILFVIGWIVLALAIFLRPKSSVSMNEVILVDTVYLFDRDIDLERDHDAVTLFPPKLKRVRNQKIEKETELDGCYLSEDNAQVVCREQTLTKPNKNKGSEDQITPVGCVSTDPIMLSNGQIGTCNPLYITTREFFCGSSANEINIKTGQFQFVVGSEDNYQAFFKGWIHCSAGPLKSCVPLSGTVGCGGAGKSYEYRTYNVVEGKSFPFIAQAYPGGFGTPTFPAITVEVKTLSANDDTIIGVYYNGELLNSTNPVVGGGPGSFQPLLSVDITRTVHMTITQNPNPNNNNLPVFPTCQCGCGGPVLSCDNP